MFNPFKIPLKALTSRWFQKSFIVQSGLFLLILILLSFGVRQSLRFYLIHTTEYYGLHQIDTIKEFPNLLKFCEQKKWNEIDSSLEISIHNQSKVIFCKDNNTFGPHLEFLQERNDYSYLKNNNQNKLYLYVEKRIVESRACKNCVIQIGLPIQTYQPLLLQLDKILVPFSLGIYLVVLALSLWGGINIIRPLTEILRKITKLKNMHAQTLSPINASENKIDEWDWAQQSLDHLQNEMEKTFGQMAVENRKMATLLESISDSIIALDKEEKVIFANNQFKFNFIPIDLTTFNIYELNILKVINRNELSEMFYRAIETGIFVRKRNLELSVRGGVEIKYYDLSVNPIKDSNELTLGCVCIFHDVTERRLAEQMREDFVSNVSHEIRTPLTAMKGYVQMLNESDKHSPEEIKMFLNKIESNSDRLNLLFQDILTLSLIESQPDLSREKINFQELTENVLSNLTHSYSSKNINVKTIYEIESGEANPGLLEQILINLVVNAFKYTKDSGEIIIRWSAHKPSNEDELAISDSWFDLEVKDTGIGIEAVHIPRLFERFYRVDHSRSRDMGGTGLGLAIVKHIAQNHLGKVIVQSTPGISSTFIVSIPNIQGKLNL